jgi:uncharacterized protein (DUF2336 family)
MVDKRANAGRKVGFSFVKGPKGRKPTRAEAEAMAAALFDSMSPQVADDARKS